MTNLDNSSGSQPFPEEPDMEEAFSLEELEMEKAFDEEVAHAAAKKKQLRHASKAERIIAIQAEYVILHPQLKKAVNRVLWMIKQQPRSRAPGLIVTGATNSGKTTLGNAILKAYSQLARPRLSVVFALARS